MPPFLLVLLALGLPVSLASASVESLIERANTLKLSDSREWHRTVQYEPKKWGGFESLADDPRYFMSEDGATNPQAELEATIRAFYQPVIEDHLKREVITIRENPSQELLEEEAKLPQHPICQFPARLNLLKSVLNWDGADLPKISCNRFKHFKDRLSPGGVSLVFSSFFLGSPSSTFGHTLLRIHNSGLPTTQVAGQTTRSELLDTGVNYAANPTVTNPILYAFFGLAGLFPGTFTAVPYYLKVREYNDHESRDLWSYRLNLSPQEVERLVELLWEVGSTHYDYYYFTENCATQMLNILDAAAPRLNLRAQIPYYVIPSATVHALFAQPGLVLERGYRPSVRREFYHRYGNLKPQQIQALDALIERKPTDQALAPLTDTEKVETLDTWSDYIEFIHGDAIKKEQSDALILKRESLVERSKIRLKSAPLGMPQPELEAPERAHGVRRFQLSSGYSDRFKGFVSIDWRFAMHDMTDATPGYPLNTQVEFFTVKGTVYWDRPNFELEQLRIFAIQSLTPINRFEKPKSYVADLRYIRTTDADYTGNQRSGRAEMNVGGGYTIPILSDRYAVGAMGEIAAQYSAQFLGSNVRLAAGPRAYALLNFSHHWKWLMEYKPEWRLLSSSSYHWTASTEMKYSFGKSFATSANYLHSRQEERSSLAIQWYF